METARLNEAELLRLGFSRPSVAALRNIQRVTGTETESTTIPDIDSSLLGVNSQISVINDDIDSLHSSLATTNTNVANLRGDLTTTQSVLSAAQSDIVDLQGEKEDVANKVTSLSAASNDVEYPSAKVVYDELQDKQDVLVSGVNIRTVNGNTLLGSTDLVITGGGSYSQILSAVSLRV